MRALKEWHSRQSADWVDLSPEAMCERAVRSTGLSDFGDGTVLDRAQSLSNALRAGSSLTPVGAIYANIYYRTRLENKLRLVAVPDDSLEPLHAPPIFVLGFYRTGTTFLHHLLAAGASCYAAPFWQMLTPCPVSRFDAIDRSSRRLRAGVIAKLVESAAELDAIHPVRLDWPEEDCLLLDNDLLGPMQYHVFGCFEHAFETLDWDSTSVYTSLRKQFRILQRDAGGRRLVCKAPLHTWFLDALLAEFPDARFVFTHREPVSAISSCCSLSSTGYTVARRQPQLAELGAFWRDFGALGLERARATWSSIPDAQKIDVPLRALSSDPAGTARRVFEHFGVAFDAPTSEAVSRVVAGRDGRPVGSHQHSLATFGLDEKSVASRFAEYADEVRELEHAWHKGA